MADTKRTFRSPSKTSTEDVDRTSLEPDIDSEVTDPSSGNNKQRKQNDVDWTEVNKKLRQHGLQPLKFLHPADVQHLGGNAICLDASGSKIARENFIALIADCDRRQDLVQELILTNNQLKDDVARQSAMTEKYFGKMKDLKIMLESSRARVQEMERSVSKSSQKSSSPSRSVSTTEDPEILANTKAAIHARCKQLEYKCEAQEKELERMKNKIRKMAAEDEKRSSRQQQVFQEFKKRTARAHNVMDEKLLDVIDSYEKQIQSLQRELEYFRSRDLSDVERPEGFSDTDSTSFLSVPETSDNLKDLIRNYEKTIKDQNHQIKKLEETKDLIQLDMGSRPEVKDYRASQLRIKKLEKLLSLHNIGIPGERKVIDPFRLKRKFSTRVDDLEFLPLDLCHHYIKGICAEFEIDDLEEMLPRVQKLASDLDSIQIYENFCHNVQDLINSRDALSDTNRKTRLGSPKRLQLTSGMLDHLMSILENWKQDEDDLEELQLSLNRLSERVAPWLKIHLTGEPSVSKIITAMDKLTYEDDVKAEKENKDRISRTVLENIVQHFQTLFDVPSVSGVYARMNDVYTKLGEVHNVLNTLRNLLGLSPTCKSSAIVDAVGRLFTAHQSTTVQQLKQLLQTEDLDGIIRRLEEHSEFFPAFFEIMNKLFEILDVHRMDQVIPAVRALKMLAN
ncbi:hypothetical protein CHS0354_031332 [Potamilus streckersoni]|uniref:Centrosomal protein of 70 kDa n=1 Tax=Potamilus streckersoni TaxID=2493646 RepID=A0AAE0WAV8_9BIVA|nr:hypothetical protein CHS0354_031332 [Potamilus streckersoni]